MSCLEKLFEGLAVDEDEVALKQMRAWYGPLFHWALIFPRYKPEHLILTLVLWLLYITMFSWNFALLAWSVILELETLQLWGLLFHFELLLVFGIVSVTFFNTERPQMAVNHRRVASDMGSYSGGRIYLEEEPIRLKKKMGRETLAFMLMPVSIGIVAGFVLLLPYIARMGTDVETYTKNGVNMNLPIPMYYPFPTHEGIGHLVALGSQLLAAALLSMVVVSLLLSLIFFSQQLKYEYQVLGYALKTLLRRAARLYRTDHPGKPKIETLDPLYQKYVGQILRQCIIHHFKIVECLRTFDDTQLKWPAALAYGVGTGSIALSLITIMTALDSKSYQDVVLFSMLGVSEVMSLLLLSLVGETITTEVGITQPYILRAGGLVDICLDTFSSIMNSSYSFFNLLNVR